MTKMMDSGRPLDEVLPWLRGLYLQHEVALSPDGRMVAATMVGGPMVTGGHDYSTGASRFVAGAHLVVFRDGGDETVLADPERGRSWSPRWCPDGTRLAFLADRGGRVEPWVFDVATEQVTCAADVAVAGDIAGLDAPVWSPDGRRLYVFATTTIAPANRPVDHQPQPTVDVLVSPDHGRDPRQVSKVTSQRRIVSIDVASGEVAEVLRGVATENAELALSPDGAWLAFYGAQRNLVHEHVETLQTLFVVAAAGGVATAVADELTVGRGAGRHRPAWSPSGGHLAFLHDGALHLADTGDRFAVHTAIAGEAGLSETFLLWHPDGSGLIGVTNEGQLTWLNPDRGTAHAVHAPDAVVRNNASGQIVVHDGRLLAFRSDFETETSELVAAPIDGGPPATLLSIDGSVEAQQLLRVYGASGDAVGEKIVFVVSRHDSPPDLWACRLDGSDLRRLTNFNPVVAATALGRTTRVEFRSDSGDNLGIKVLLPPGWDGRPAPTIMCCYPGNFDSQLPSVWRSLLIVHPHLLSTAGLAVAWVDLPSRYPGWGTTADEVVGVMVPALDALVAAGIADAERVAVMGHSAGAITIGRLLVATDRFRVAVLSHGGYDRVSAFGRLEVVAGEPVTLGYLASGDRGGPWDATDRYIEDSPVFHVPAIDAQILLIHGTDDRVVPVAQSDELFVGLRRLGKPVTYLRYRGEGHVPNAYSGANRLHVTRSVLEFLAQHLQ